MSIFRVPLHSQVVYMRTYSRVKLDGSREQWADTVQRYIDFIAPRCRGKLSDDTMAELKQAILNMDVMPSMRALATAGPAAERDNMVMYNCAYTEVDCVEAITEIMVALLGGTGVGFSVEDLVVQKLPIVARLQPSAEARRATEEPIVVQDSAVGWKDAWFKLLDDQWNRGILHRVDYSLVRPAGAPMRTLQGFASGPDVLRKLFVFAEEMLKAAQGRQLRPDEVHRLVCQVAQVTVRGGTRRSALISLSNLDNAAMRFVKTKDSAGRDPVLYASNNSAVVVDSEAAVESGLARIEMEALAASTIGERGIFNREAAKQACRRIGRSTRFNYGTNPCGEIILRSGQLCNLCEVIIRSYDTPQTLRSKVRLAALLGTIQSTYVHFPNVRPIWAQNCAEERLLGVSLTGICDNRFMCTPGPELAAALRMLHDEASTTNKIYADIFGIPASAAITCIKPSGTVSLVANCSPGIHPRLYDTYIRNIRIARSDPLFVRLAEVGIPWEALPAEGADTVALRFPVRSPPGALLADHVSARDQMRLAAFYTEHWADHNVSCTVYVPPGGWPDLVNEVISNLFTMRGMSFIDTDCTGYNKPPFEKISAAEYDAAMALMPSELHQSGALDLKLMELERQKSASSLFAAANGVEYACTAGGCEIRPSTLASAEKPRTPDADNSVN